MLEGIGSSATQLMELVDKGGQEHRLSRAAEPGDSEPDVMNRHPRSPLRLIASRPSARMSLIVDTRIVDRALARPQ